MLKSFLVLASAGTLTLGIPFAGVSGSSTIAAGAQGRFQQWMRRLSLDASLSTNARINTMLNAANQDGLTAQTAITNNHRGMAYQESSAMVNAMLTAEAWWQEAHMTASSSDAGRLGTSLKTLATVKTKLMAKGWWSNSSRLGRAMTEASIKGSALLNTTGQGTSTTVQTHNSSQSSLISHGTLQVATRSNNYGRGTLAGRVSTNNSSPSKIGSTTSTSSASSRGLTIRPHSGFEANLGLSGHSQTDMGSHGDLSPAVSNPQIEGTSGVQTQTTVSSTTSIFGQLGL